MGSKKPQPPPVTQTTQNEAQQQYQRSQTPSQNETDFSNYRLGIQDNATRANQQAFTDYGNIMGRYQNFADNMRAPTQFTYQNVAAKRPNELGEAYGYLREAMPGYRDFATTGGYSPQDIQELRARGISPIRSAYGNTMMELDRARSLGGGYSPGYTAALSRAQRELPGQMADAMTTVNAGLADSIRQGKMFGLSGITNTGSTMGGLSSQEAQRMLQADLANQEADLRAQGMSEESIQNRMGMQLAAMNGMTGLYGTTPGMANMFGNQAMDAWRTQFGAEAARNSQSMSWLELMLRAQQQQFQQQQQKVPWWKTALGIAGSVAPWFAMMSSEDSKEDIQEIKDIRPITRALRELPLYTWKYKGDKNTHFGPIAQEFKRKFGIGDGTTIHMSDVAGVLLAAGKESLSA